MSTETIEAFKASEGYADLKQLGVIPEDKPELKIEDIYPEKPPTKPEDDPEFWAEYRGDYLDLRDYLKIETEEAKFEFLKGLTKARVTLIREHILLYWTFIPERREDLEFELEVINKLMYSGKDELVASVKANGGGSSTD